MAYIYPVNVTPLPSLPSFLPQKDHQQPVFGPGGQCHSALRFHRWPRGRLTASSAQGHQHAEDLYHRHGCCQEEVTVHPD
jgi:hypothetical protein